jgi:hypothetical protein
MVAETNGADRVGRNREVGVQESDNFKQEPVLQIEPSWWPTLRT